MNMIELPCRFASEIKRERQGPRTMACIQRGHKIIWKLSAYPRPIPGLADSLLQADGSYNARELEMALREHGERRSLGFNSYYEADSIAYALREKQGLFWGVRRRKRRRILEKKFGKINWPEKTNN